MAWCADGFVRSYGRKRAAEAAAKRVVAGVANDIEVRLPLLHQRPDPVIAAMRWERGDMICRRRRC